MAGANLLTLIDDIAAVLDDIAIMTKVAAKKSAGVLGDDLALNAQQVTGVRAERELPIVWAVAKGAFINKAILVPVALLISPVEILVNLLLLLGGLFLCFEGVEKVVHKFFHKADDKAHKEARKSALQEASVDPVKFEKEKIKGAIRTDFILSAEIIVIALGTMPADATWTAKIFTLIVIAVAMNVFVYGLVAGIVKLDDLGMHLSQGEGFRKTLGGWILRAAPMLMKGLGIAGTAAMFLVGGGIVVHIIGPLHHWVEHVAHDLGGVGFLFAPIVNAIVGIACGAIILVAFNAVQKARGVDSHH